MRSSRLFWLLAVGIAVWPAWAGALTIELSGISSDLTPASQLDAIVEFEVGDFDLGNPGDELRITLTNPDAGMGGDALFNINEIYWNASGSVSGLTLLSAVHSVAGDVTAAWQPVELGSMANGWDPFDYALTDGVGSTNPAIVEPGESVVFLLDIDSLGPVLASDFVVPQGNGYTVAAKFVNGPPDPENPLVEDSAFGTVPEPATGLLSALGLVALAAGRRSLRRG